MRRTRAPCHLPARLGYTFERAVQSPPHIAPRARRIDAAEEHAGHVGHEGYEGPEDHEEGWRGLYGHEFSLGR